jgi:outer membrane murein-binding lipoprotein Lpp
MSTKKRIAAVAITIAALTAGSAGVASAHDGVNKGLVKATVLADLVKAGTITQAQADAISKKFDEVRAAKQAERAAKQAERAAKQAAKQAANPNKAGKHGKGAKVSNT